MFDRFIRAGPNTSAASWTLVCTAIAPSPTHSPYHQCSNSAMIVQSTVASRTDRIRRPEPFIGSAALTLETPPDKLERKIAY